MIPIHTRQECGAIAKLIREMRHNPNAVDDSKADLISFLSDTRARLEDKWVNPATEMLSESDDEAYCREHLIPQMQEALEWHSSAVLEHLAEFTDTCRDRSLYTDNGIQRAVCDAWLAHWELLGGYTQPRCIETAAGIQH